VSSHSFPQYLPGGGAVSGVQPSGGEIVSVIKPSVFKAIWHFDFSTSSLEHTAINFLSSFIILQDFAVSSHSFPQYLPGGGAVSGVQPSGGEIVSVIKPSVFKAIWHFDFSTSSLEHTAINFLSSFIILQDFAVSSHSFPQYLPGVLNWQPDGGFAVVYVSLLPIFIFT